MKISISTISIYIISFLYVIFLIFWVSESELNTTTIKDISIFTSSTSTLIIALLLFDRFDYRKKIFDKKLQIVIELIEFLKKTRIGISQKTEIIQFCGGLSIDRKAIINFKKRELDFNAKIIFNHNEVYAYFEKIEMYRINPFMPESIAEV